MKNEPTPTVNYGQEPTEGEAVFRVLRTQARMSLERQISVIASGLFILTVLSSQNGRPVPLQMN